MLRDLLQVITNESVVSAHRARIEEAREKFGHAITVLTPDGENLAYNCVMFALGLENDRDYFAMASWCPREVHASTDFLRFLYDEGYLAEREDCESGCLVVYSLETQFRHIGRVVEDGRVCSKWGIGNLYEHGLFEVPSSYGAEIRYFEPLDAEKALDAFFEYARRRGVEFPPGEG